MGFRTILTIIGALLATLGVTMLIPAMIDALRASEQVLDEAGPA